MPRQASIRLRDSYGEMNGYTPDSGKGRELFQREARAYLVAIGRLLAHHGIAQMSIDRLRATAGAAGGVTGTFRTQRGLLTIDIATSRAEGHSARPDHVVVAAVFTAGDTRSETRYLDASFDSVQMAVTIAAFAIGDRPLT
jgi:hypothetical protein